MIAGAAQWLRTRSGAWTFLVRRVLQAVPVMLGIVVFSFLLLHLAPGDIVDVMAGEAGTGDAAFMDALRVKYGLDQPLAVQLLHYLAQVARLDLGFSMRSNMPVLQLIGQRLGPTVLLMGSSIVLALGFGVLAGTVAALRRNTLLDDLVSLLALLAYAMPIFWVGLVLIVVVAIKLALLPTGGFADVIHPAHGAALLADIGRHLVLPAVTLSLFYFAVYTRMTRASVLETMGMDYVRTARAKGLRRDKVIVRHILRNALLPVVTLVGMQTASLLGGAVVVETVFDWPGLGRLTYDAVFQRDYSLLVGILILSSAAVVAVNIVVDLAYARLDPRIALR